MFSPTQWLAGFGVVTAIFLAGMSVDHLYGLNAQWRANREAADAAKNEALTYLAEHEDALGNDEDMRFGEGDAAFRKASLTIEPCVLSGAQAQALNLIGD
jgi:hypothetical protein